MTGVDFDGLEFMVFAAHDTDSLISTANTHLSARVSVIGMPTRHLFIPVSVNGRKWNNLDFNITVAIYTE
jgi:hypothetical protein